MKIIFKDEEIKKKNLKKSKGGVSTPSPPQRPTPIIIPILRNHTISELLFFSCIQNLKVITFFNITFTSNLFVRPTLY